jgi:hypothetical protein
LIKGGESLDLLSNYYYILREDSRMWSQLREGR